jgi:hypothetical protein
MFSPGQFSAQNSSPTSNGYNFFQSSVDANRTVQPSQNKVISSDQARSIFSGKDPETRKQTYETMKAQGYTFADEKAPAPAPEQGFFSGALEKTGQAFNKGMSRIGEAGEGIVNDKYTIPEGLVR